MSLRIRVDGTILCAAMHPKKKGDTYVPDGLHYRLSVLEKVIVTEPHEKHQIHGQWWWHDEVPEGIQISDFYLNK